MSSPSARVFLLAVLCQWSVCVKVLRRDMLRVREEWSGAEERLQPQLRLHMTLLQQEVFVRMRLRIRPLLANETLKIDFSDSETGDSYTLHVWKQNRVLWWITSDDLQQHEARIQTSEKNRTSHQAVWILRYECFPARPGSTITVSVHRDGAEPLSRSLSIQPSARPRSINLQSPAAEGDPVPNFSITADEHHKRFTVRMDTHQRVKLSLCYKRSYPECEVIHFEEIDPPVNQTVLSFPSLVPCVCVQLWFTGPDARRNTQCPLKERILPHGGDILSSSSARVLGSVLHWEPLCPDGQSDPSVSLCWRIHTQNSYCVPAPNATLYGTKLDYNVSAVDKHPQMCVKFSLNGSHRVFCPFESEGRSEWSVTVVPGSLHLHLHLMSNMAASFAAQLCARDEDSCVSQGHVVSRQLDGGAAVSELSLPFPLLSSGLCVQVWRVDLQGRRVLCPDFTHRRWGLVIGASLTLLMALMLLICISRWMFRRRTPDWRSAERRPVLLVCSSDDPAHISAVCSLASGLQGELCMDVRLAQWMQCHPQSLAQLGPVPWLYGQCQAVQKAGGLVLIAWSPDAHQAYLKWRRRERKAELCKTSAMEEEEWISGEEENLMESSVTAPVFAAALSCLCLGIRNDGCGRGFGLLHFQSLNDRSCIPKRLRCVQKYCLPKDLSSFVHDLTGSWDGCGKSRGRCWPRLLSKALSFFVSRQLAARLEAKLVPTDRPKFVPSISRKLISGTKQKTWRRKRRLSSCLSKKVCLKKKTVPQKPLDW